ncbi:MAG: aromatic amino acid ammonia-lyase, partial [Proteobacteria bacterium]|nr:aromatic amino acid ammonia-lyase [Pseudomonadota bacterium]
MHETVCADSVQLRIEDVCQVAHGASTLRLGELPAFRERIERGARYLANTLAAGKPVYGVTTGYGDSCTTAIPVELLEELPKLLVRYHGCGSGRLLDEVQVRAVLVARLNSLARGYSAVRWELLENLAALLRHELSPVIPEEGSVGASGDLTPLSYIAAVLIGERDVFRNGERVPAATALRDAGIKPLVLRPKEGLALMNGTSVMTGLACLAWERADYLSRMACRITSLVVRAMRGNPQHFDARLFATKPHAGQNEAAEWIRNDLLGDPDAGRPVRIQDRYSLRCAPHVIGVLRDALPWMKRDIENELNSANDNPLIDPEELQIYHGGHFYG